MLRDKDRAQAEHCDLIADAATQALDWFTDNDALVGYRKATLDRAIKRCALEARKLQTAAARPMSVGVFGASQTGKSFLIGSFIAPRHKPVAVVFGPESDPVRMDFLNDVNPVGGDETTGLVTRFSVRRYPPPAPDFPVALRLLSEADLVKVLANTYALDLRGRPDQPFDQARIGALVEALEPRRMATPHPGLSGDALLDLEQYVQEEVDEHPINASAALREDYWLVLERLAPWLAPPDRAKLLAPLWGELPELTDLYLELRAALDALDHAEMAYIPLEAIRDRARGVLHVRTIYHLDPPPKNGSAAASEGREPIPVMTQTGRRAPIPKAVVTALTAELCVSLDQAPWPFFDHTDLLDFPGARGRENKPADDLLRGPDAKPQARAYCFLRGKVAVLFDKYSADFDLNSMMLCCDDRNQEVRRLADLVHRWVARTHGATGQERERRPTALFLCLTKADLLFDLKAGATADQVIRTRIGKDIEFYASWTHAWQGDRPFNNVFLIRNPKFARRDLFEYESIPAGSGEGVVPAEKRLLPAVAPEIARFRDTFFAQDVVQRHIADPGAKLDAVLAINDGGISHLADRLAPTCDPDLKFNQIQPRLEALAQQVQRLLGDFYEAGDLQRRMQERREEASRVVQRLARQTPQIGRFIAFLETDQDTMGTVFLEVARGEAGSAAGSAGAADQTCPNADAATGTGTGTGAESPEAAYNADPGLELNISLDFLGQDAPAPQATHAPGHETSPGAGPGVCRGLAISFAEAAVARWLFRISDAAQSPGLAEQFGLGPAEVTTVARELEIAARRYRLAETIAEAISPVLRFHQRPDEHMHRVAMVAAQEINRLVCRLGRDRPGARNNGKTLFVRPPPAMDDHGLPALPENTAALSQVRGATLQDWLHGLVLLAEESAASTEGGVIDVVQNARMGRILALVARALNQPAEISHAH